MNRSSTPSDRELLDLLLADEGVERSAATEIASDSSNPPPLSRAQRRLWFLQQAEPQSSAYNVVSAVRLTGVLSIEVFAKALNEIVRRHQVLRSRFSSSADRPEIEVLAELRLHPKVVDLRGLPHAEQLDEVRRHTSEETSQPFDLELGPLLRVRLLQTGDDEHVVILTMHHIVTDAWSMGVFITEFSTLYSEFAAGNPSPLGDLEIQYGDFARWQQEWLEGEDAATQLAWWKKQLHDLTMLELPLDRARSKQPAYASASCPFKISPQVSAALKSLSREEDSTLFITLLAAFSVLLHRYSRQEDIVIGTPIANRSRRELEPLIGFFVNTLVMRSDLSGEPSFRSLLHRVRDFSLDAYEHQDLPFDVLVNEIMPDRTAVQNPMFQVAFSLENAPTGRLDLNDLSITPLEVDSKVAKFDLLLNMSDTPDGLAGGFEYRADLFREGTVDRMREHFEILLSSIVADADRTVASLPLLLESERKQLLVDWNDTAMDFPGERCIHQLLEEQVERTPDALALVFGSQRLTYADVNARANRLARHLQKLGVGAEMLVGIYVERSLEMVIGLLGILKAGGAYVPLDPEYPAERLAFILEDTQASLVLTQESLLEGLSDYGGEVVCLDRDREEIDRHSPDNLPSSVNSENLAYVIYTSGSTGKPKGVMVEHHGVVNLACAQRRILNLDTSSRVVLFASLNFDASVWEIFATMLSGSCLCVGSREELAPGAALADFVDQHAVTHLTLPPSLLGLMRTGDLSTCETLVVAGESCPQELVHAWSKSRRMFNAYGPTEITVCATISDPLLEGVSLNIGKPIPNTKVYLLDGAGNPAPRGVVGELHIGGAGLARGYLNRPELTEEKFVPNSFGDIDGERLYKTGDLCRWLPDGNLEFLGRSDHQVKIHGFRIELGEIESALLRHPQIRQAVVLAREDRLDRRELVAYAAGDSLSVSDLRQSLSAELPTYMIPAKFVLLDELPLNENGKINRKILPAPEEGKPSSADEFAGPRDELEECLAGIWQEVLRFERVGIHDNYFELGGDSITAIQLVSRLKRAGWQIKVPELFHFPTIAQLAPRLLPYEETADIADEEGEVPLTPVQHWFFENFHGPRHHFNQAVLLRATEPLDEARLQEALTVLEARYDALRLVFQDSNGNPTQFGRSVTQSMVLEFVDLRGESDGVAAVKRRAEEMQRSIDLEHGPLFKAAIFRCTDGDRLFMVAHHLAVDGVSWRILLEDLQIAYQGHDLGARTASFRSWAEHIQQVVTGDALRADLNYWSAVESVASVQLPIDADASTNRYGDVLTIHETLSEEDTRWLLAGAHQALQTEIMDLLLTALGRALQTWTGEAETLVSLEGHGRDFDHALDLTRSVGWFTSIYPFLLSTTGSDVSQQIVKVKEDLRALPNKGIGYGMLRYLANTGFTAAPQISFNYLGRFDHAGDHDGIFEFTDEPMGREVSEQLQRAHELDFVGVVGSRCLEMRLEFNPQRLSLEAATGLLSDLMNQLRLVGEHCRGLAAGDVLPSGQGEDTASERGSVAVSSDSDSDSDKSTEIARRFVEEELVGTYPLSPMQEGLLFQALYRPHDDAYLVQTIHRLTGPWRSDVFEECWNILAQRHVVLRSTFVHEDLERPVRAELGNRPPEFLSEDLRELSAAEADRHVKLYRTTERQRGFDLQRDELMRVALFRREDEAYDLVWSYHHIVLDGWCVGILYRELMEAYTALCDGREPVLAPPAPWSRYTDWLQQFDQDQARRFWMDYLAGYEQTATLPKWQLAATEGKICEERLTIDADVSAKLTQMAARCGVTLNTVVQCLWGVLLYRYNDVEDVVVGSIVSGRPSDLEGVEEMVGVFINAIPVRIRSAEGQSFTDLLSDVQASAFDALPHSYLPLAEIQAASSLGNDLFDHLLVFENYPRAFPDQDEGKGGTPLQVELSEVYDHTHYDLTVTIDGGELIEFGFSYRDSIYSREQIQRLGQHLATLARLIADNPGLQLSDVSALQLLSDEELNEQLVTWNSTEAAFPESATIHELFEAQVREHGERTALVCGDTRLSYTELNGRSNQLAHLLRQKGVVSDTLVALLLDRSPEMVVAMLAVLKAGGAYLPIEPSLPRARIGFILEDSGAAQMVSIGKHAELIPADISSAILLDLEADFEDLPTTDLPNSAAPENLAYSIYTSGSTGKPKGALIEHRNVVRLLVNEKSPFTFTSDDVWTMFHSYSFDFSVWEMYGALLYGGKLVIVPSKVTKDPSAYLDLLERERVTVLNQTPSAFYQVAHEACNGLPKELALRCVIFGGEALEPAQLNRWAESYPNARLVNMYGITETTVHVTYKELTLADIEGSTSSVGVPIPTTTLYVMDSDLRLLPVGVPGEICVGGDGVSRGYLNRSALTEAKFVSNPYRPEERLYRSGDLGRLRPDGELVYLGRIDDQVQIRGFRVEPGEIEAVLSTHPQVQKAAVLASAEDGQQSLLAYIVADTGETDSLSVSALREHLRSNLPEYMVPSAFVFLEQFPLTANGKLDRRALPAPEERPDLDQSYVAPRSEIEEQLCAIWKSILQIDRIGVEDNFFELGGHSLKAMQVVARLRSELGADVGLGHFMQCSTLADLATLVSEAPRTEREQIEPAPLQAQYQLSPAQQRLWLVHSMSASASYNMPVALEIDRSLDGRVLHDAFAALVERHEVLRTRFVAVEGEPFQEVQESSSFVVEETDLRNAGYDAEQAARKIVDDLIAERFDLAEPPLFRLAAIHMPNERAILVLVMHHIVGDGWSMNVLFRELLALYSAFARGLASPLSPLRIQYKDVVHWQLSRDREEDERFWLEEMKDAPTHLKLPYDFPVPEARSFRGNVVNKTIDRETTLRLREVASRAGSSISNVMLTLFQLLMYRVSGQKDFCVGVALANRNHPDVESLIGFFVNMLPIRTQVQADMEFEELLQQTTEKWYLTLDHQQFEFDELVRLLNPQRSSNRQPLINVVFEFQQNFADLTIGSRSGKGETVASALSDDEFNVAPFEFDFPIAKFDLTLTVLDDGDELQMTLEYDSEVFSEQTVEGYLTALHDFAGKVASSPQNGEAS